jgi:hypothetical protein
MKKFSAVARTAIGVILPIAAFAQSGGPLDSQAPVSPLRYESALGGYRPMDEKVTPAREWRSANDTVRDTGSMSGMAMGGESGTTDGMDQDAMKDMDHGAMKGMKGVGDMKKPKPEETKLLPSQDGMSDMDMSSGDHAKHGKEMP